MRVLWISLALLVIDQLTKVWVAASMFPGQSIPVLGDWFKLTYTTNPGIAFGLEVGPKLFLSLFSIVATIAIIVYLWFVRTAPLGYRVALATIIGGAMGNVIDRTFYGIIYGYAPLFYGEVVDFIHFDVWRGTVDLPLLGPIFVPLFPIWNVADMAIVLGVVAIIVLQGRFQRQMATASAPAAGTPGRAAEIRPVKPPGGESIPEEPAGLDAPVGRGTDNGTPTPADDVPSRADAGDPHGPA